MNIVVTNQGNNGFKAKYITEGMVFVSMNHPTEESAKEAVIQEYISWKNSTQKP